MESDEIPVKRERDTTETILQHIIHSVQDGNKSQAIDWTRKALEAGGDPSVIVKRGFIVGIRKIGDRFGSGEAFLPEVLMAARAMKEALQLVLPKLSESNFDYVGRMAIGTVQGDIHDIGKNIVAAVFTGSGFEVNDLGIDVAPEKFVEAAEEGIQIIGMSALIGTTMPSMRLTIDAIEKAGLRSNVKIIVGGPLVTQDFAEKIGADAYAEDAFSGVNKVRAFLSIRE